MPRCRVISLNFHSVCGSRWWQSFHLTGARTEWTAVVDESKKLHRPTTHNVTSSPASCSPERLSLTNRARIIPLDNSIRWFSLCGSCNFFATCITRILLYSSRRVYTGSQKSDTLEDFSITCVNFHQKNNFASNRLIELAPSPKIRSFRWLMYGSAAVHSLLQDGSDSSRRSTEAIDQYFLWNSANIFLAAYPFWTLRPKRSLWFMLNAWPCARYKFSLLLLVFNYKKLHYRPSCLIDVFYDISWEKISWWLIGHFYIIGHESYRIRRNNAK